MTNESEPMTIGADELAEELHVGTVRAGEAFAA